MELRELSVGQKFKFANGNGKTWEKISDCGDVLEFNLCRCIDDLLPAQKTGFMLVSGFNDQRMKKHANVIVCN